MVDDDSALRELSEVIAGEGKVRTQRRKIQEAVARLDRAAQRCCWKAGLGETEFEPFRPDDSERTWFRRLCARLPEFAEWLVEERMAPLVEELSEAAAVLGVRGETLVAFELGCAPSTGRGAARTFTRDTFVRLLSHAADKKVRRALAKELGAAMGQDPEQVPPLFFTEYFEVLRGNVARQGEAAIAALARPMATTAPAPQSPDATKATRSPALPAERKLPPGVRCGSDFSWLQVGPITHSFKKGNQAETVRVLFEESEKASFKDGCGLGEKEIASRIGASDTHFTIRHTFKRHPAKDTLIRRVGKGQWALFFSPGDSQSR